MHSASVGSVPICHHHWWEGPGQVPEQSAASASMASSTTSQAQAPAGGYGASLSSWVAVLRLEDLSCLQE